MECDNFLELCFWGQQVMSGLLKSFQDNLKPAIILTIEEAGCWDEQPRGSVNEFHSVPNLHLKRWELHIPIENPSLPNIWGFRKYMGRRGVCRYTSHWQMHGEKLAQHCAHGKIKNMRNRKVGFRLRKRWKGLKLEPARYLMSKGGIFSCSDKSCRWSIINL